uniref:Ig-like domain-containing protein n=1 Tax=Ornithorhynchus anatinus TaxID=9258 RepID=A0A6I8PKS2_ORNAN
PDTCSLCRNPACSWVSSMAQSISQPQTAPSRKEGESVTLPCTYSTGYSSYYLYWYKQLPTGEMTYLIHQYSENRNDARKDRFSVNFQKEKKSIRLTIARLELGDSAVYFCALSEPTMKDWQEEPYKNPRSLSPYHS